jgi:hypothetical protein
MIRYLVCNWSHFIKGKEGQTKLRVHESGDLWILELVDSAVSCKLRKKVVCHKVPAHIAVTHMIHPKDVPKLVL